MGFTYGTSNNNGNVQTQTITIPGGLNDSQTYAYDNVNRLISFSETTGQANQAYSYDAFGNRSMSGWIPYSGQTPTVGSLFPNNQWAAGAGGVSYDSAGNQTAIAIAGGTTTRPSCASTLQPGVAMLRISCYDAENRMTVATTAAPVTTTYVYDGDGRRVQKTMGGSSSIEAG